MHDGTPAPDPTALYAPGRLAGGDWGGDRAMGRPVFEAATHDPVTKTYAELTEESRALADRYQKIIQGNQICWQVDYRLLKKLGSGGQGVVFLADRSGAFGVSFRLALKFFRPDGYRDAEVYREEMSRMARLSMQLARIQQDHLVDVYNVIEYRGIQTLVMEWVDGYDLRFLLTPGALALVRQSVDHDTWEYVNDVILSEMGSQVRLKPGVAIAILRDCLSALAALHREDLVHGDLKPSNIMIKRTGNCKIVDFGSAFARNEPPLRPTWTPRYAAVEVLDGAAHTPASDLASLGYILVEMLSGECLFASAADDAELLEMKRQLPGQLRRLLPEDVARNTMLTDLVLGLIAPDPAGRFASAESADMSEEGAAEFQRQLVRGDLASEYENDLRRWLQELE